MCNGAIVFCMTYLVNSIFRFLKFREKNFGTPKINMHDIAFMLVKFGKILKAVIFHFTRLPAKTNFKFMKLTQFYDTLNC